MVVVAGAAVGVHASPSGSGVNPAGSAVAAGSSSATDPHEVVAQQEIAHMLAAFQAPPGATESAGQPDPLPSGLQHPPIQAGAQTQAGAVAWYSAPQSPDQVLAWVRAHPPTGSSLSGSGSSSVGPSFVSFAFPGTLNWLVVSPLSGSDGRTVVRLDAIAVWTPSRPAATKLGYGAPSVSVVTTAPPDPRQPLPASEARTQTATAPLIIHQVVDLLNALQPQIRGAVNCPSDDGTRVRITLPGLAVVSADPVGCEAVEITPQGGAPQFYTGGPDLIAKVYALFGITWTRTGALPQGIERTLASGTP
ncbi:hypothetical protein [Catenulispora sp. GP43]|uniref:hypothetical protein n=1 Tax=Catenulispora sp. GP43 TaxID=3156263 RepID=UPI003511D7B3